MQNYKRQILLAGLIILAVITRLIDHPANFSPIMAIAIFSGAFFEDKKLAFLIPLSAMFISDLFLGFYLISIFVYSSFAIGLFIGFYLRNRIKVTNIIIASLVGSVVFFLITNFGAWLTDPMYQPLTTESLIRCYNMAIPFFRTTLAGDLIYTTVMFGSFLLAEKHIPALEKK
jgi:hypothetical protein